jgi:molybdenum cofactor guanylyltransferase
MKPPRNTITGILLAGGQSRRMFPGAGGDKCLRDLGGRPMLARIVERLAPQVDRLVINANGDPSRFSAFDMPVVADAVADFAGPLAGIHAGLRWCERHAPDIRHIVTVSTDAPFLPLDLVARLAAAVGDEAAAIAMARSAGELHPVIGLWPVALADDLEAALSSGTRKVLAWTDRHRVAVVDFPFVAMAGRDIDPFFNANHPAEFDEARRLIEG